MGMGWGGKGYAWRDVVTDHPAIRHTCARPSATTGSSTRPSGTPAPAPAPLQAVAPGHPAYLRPPQRHYRQ